MTESQTDVGAAMTASQKMLTSPCALTMGRKSVAIEPARPSRRGHVLLHVTAELKSKVWLRTCSHTPLRKRGFWQLCEGLVLHAAFAGTDQTLLQLVDLLPLVGLHGVYLLSPYTTVSPAATNEVQHQSGWKLVRVLLPQVIAGGFALQASFRGPKDHRNTRIAQMIV